jgi:ABC-type transport system substrate-binding protein
MLAIESHCSPSLKSLSASGGAPGKRDEKRFPRGQHKKMSKEENRESAEMGCDRRRWNRHARSFTNLSAPRGLNRGFINVLKLLVIFGVAFSLASLPGPLSAGLHLPTVQLGHAQVAPCPVNVISCSNYWMPAGSAMDTESVLIFTDASAEFANIQSPTPGIDLTDAPLQPSLIQPLDQSNSFYVTSAISEHAYYDIQFMLAANFWGCSMNFGNSTCGVNIRQGIAHMIDRAEFVANDPTLQGQATAIDNPVPPNNGGLPASNPCAWDTSFPQSGPNCIVGAPGGTSYHLAAGAGANGTSWLQAPGSSDLDAAAAHFVAAGIATGCDGGNGTASCIASTDSRLSGISSAATANPINFFIRNDDTARLDLGNGLSEQICYLFTGSYTPPCTYLTVTRGPATAFLGYCTGCCGPGLGTCTTGVNLTWGMYTGAFSDVYPFDASLYFTYNSRFVDGIPSIIAPNGPCSAAATPSSNAANYMFLCSPAYDSISNQMEFANCLTVTGDPVVGSTSNNSTGTCSLGGLSGVGAGLQAENVYGRGAYSIPVFDRTGDQFAYLSNWQNVINGDGVGIPNFFTWLDAYSPNPAVAGTVRQGFSQTTRSVSPYIAETSHDFYIVRNIYDSLMVQNPLSNGQLIDWSALSVQLLTGLRALTYPPPPGTTQTFRFTLRSDMFFQDGRKVTSFDVAFSYLSLMATGAFQSTGLAPITGITILGPSQFDINLSSVGPFTLNYLTSPTIIPGRYWTNAGASTWDAEIGTCTSMGATCYLAQYTINSANPTTTTCTLGAPFSCTFPASTMNVNLAQTGATYDPVASHTLVGSGPFMCGTVTSSGSGTCSSSNTENPPVGGGYTLTRFGKGSAPASSISSIYFRSAGNMALWTWSEDTGDTTHDFLNYAILASCFGTQSSNCIHWMMGIGGCGGTVTSPCTIGLQQVSIVNRFVGMNWVAPSNWQTSPPAGIIPFAPVINEGSYTLNHASTAGCSVPFPTGGYDC